jgi:hypothetical protein
MSVPRLNLNNEASKVEFRTMVLWIRTIREERRIAAALYILSKTCLKQQMVYLRTAVNTFMRRETEKWDNHYSSENH